MFPVAATLFWDWGWFCCSSTDLTGPWTLDLDLDRDPGGIHDVCLCCSGRLRGGGRSLESRRKVTAERARVGKIPNSIRLRRERNPCTRLG